MTAFVAFIKAYEVWLYLLCGLGVLLALKMLTDARRLARTTLFALDQERAGEQTYRAVTLIVVLLLLMGGISSVNAFVAPVVPTAESPIVRASTPTLRIVFPSNTPAPSLTPTYSVPTGASALSPAATQVSAPRSATATRLNPALKSPPPSRVPTTPVLAFPAPTLLSPLNGDVKIGENQMNTSLMFKWAWDCERCSMGPQDRFEIVVTFVDRVTGAPRMVVGNSPSNHFLSMGAIIGGGSGEVYQKARDDTYFWYVQVKRGDQTISPSSAKWKFVWH